MEANEIIRQAIDGHTKGVALRIGKSESLVYKMMGEPEACRYTRFLQLFFAIYEENQTGGEEIFEHFRATVTLLRESRGQRLEVRGQDEKVEWKHAVRKTVRESAEAIEAALDEDDPLRVEKEVAEAIGAFRAVLKMAVAREGRAESGVRRLESKAATGGSR